MIKYNFTDIAELVAYLKTRAAEQRQLADVTPSQRKREVSLERANVWEEVASLLENSIFTKK